MPVVQKRPVQALVYTAQIEAILRNLVLDKVV
jgi:hypothetical protein